MEIEKNDVDISTLFNWGRVFELVVDDENTVDVYMRVLGDADMNRARVHALRESAELRRDLRDVNSGMRMASIRDIDDISKEDLVNYISLFSTRKISQDIIRTVKLPYPKEPKSDASLEEMEKFQKEVDEYPQKRADLIKDEVESSVEKVRKSASKKSKDSLYKEYVGLIIEELCEQRVLSSFREISTYYGCYKDDNYKERFFDSFEEFDNLESSQKAEFIRAYRTLEVETGELKKLREATP